jgi:hypothetical protein
MVLSSSDFFEFLGGTRDVLKLWIFVEVYILFEKNIKPLSIFKRDNLNFIK